MKENKLKFPLFVKVATFILLARTNRICNDSAQFETSLVKYGTGNDESRFRTQRILGGNEWRRDSLLADLFDDDELYNYNSDYKSSRRVKDMHDHHRHSHRHEHGHSHRHRTSPSKRKKNNNENDEILSLSQFYVDDDDEDDHETSSAQYESSYYDSVMNLTNERRSHSEHTISSMDIELYLGYEDDFISGGTEGSGSMLKKADSYCEGKIFDSLGALDEYKRYDGEQRRIMKQAAYKKGAKVFAVPGAVALSPLIIASFFTLSNPVIWCLATSGCVLGAALYTRSKTKNSHRTRHVQCRTY
ncbi:hypothetical protein C922_03193 [Plasmodium inui San Antonio 1]|uniref:Uncharacterized protein n=1 Tax=Plasmodium inui San Antonio 1 TaxID=1237626 RepID=W6ZZE3_9APIC|nr:hypothetical protein C922_03193 [Plasmodium inui San Antonio 1]EUD66277.1 hypothetical protein C922_03193 [Plasmodium inui San Antonio 1]